MSNLSWCLVPPCTARPHLQYVADVDNLCLLMNLLKDPSRSIQFEAFHVFKVSWGGAGGRGDSWGADWGGSWGRRLGGGRGSGNDRGNGSGSGRGEMEGWGQGRRRGRAGWEAGGGRGAAQQLARLLGPCTCPSQ